MLFIGGYEHLPNVDAVLWFVREVWPLIRARGGAQRFVIAERGKFIIQHVVHGDGGAAEHRGGGGVVGRKQQADVEAFGEFFNFGEHLQATRNDDAADAVLDGKLLDVMPVADDDK